MSTEFPEDTPESNEPSDSFESLNQSCDNVSVDRLSSLVPDSDKTGASPSLDPVERMMAKLILHEEAHFRHQTRDEKPLSDEQKLLIARDLYARKPGVFLERYSQYLDWSQDRVNFVRLCDTDDVVDYFVSKLDRDSEMSEERKSKLTTCLIRNRRLNALYRVARGGINSSVADHFTHEAMRQRDPILWESMVGQYLDEPTRRRYLDREYDTFAGYLHGELMQQEQKKMLKRAHEAQQMSDSIHIDENLQCEDLISDIDEDREREFLNVMKFRFLSGRDVNFDYKQIDNDETLDDDDNQRALDEEEKYFDAD